MKGKLNKRKLIQKERSQKVENDCHRSVHFIFITLEVDPT